MNGPLLAIDTATSQATLAVGDDGGGLLGERSWAAGHTHAETLLPALNDLFDGLGITPGSLGAIVVGTGPGGFTGLRVGLATAKTLAHGLDVPIVGVGTAEALAAAALEGAGRAQAIVVQPAGPSDRYLSRIALDDTGAAVALERPRLVAPADLVAALAEATAQGAVLVAVDLDDAGLPAEALTAGRRALAGLGAALLAAGRRALAAGRTDAADALVPAYVTLPRGVAAGGEAWSPDLR